jgi:hypothetical protein
MCQRAARARARALRVIGALGLLGHANHCWEVQGLAYRVFAPQEGALAPSWLKASRILKEDLMIGGDLAQREWPKSRFAAV